MKTMTDYTIYCSEEQTKKALELGASIDEVDFRYPISGRPTISIGEPDNSFIIPTAEQMINWLETTLIYGISISEFEGEWIYSIRTVSSSSRIHNEYFPSSSRPEATLAAIDAALDYLSQNKK